MDERPTTAEERADRLYEPQCDCATSPGTSHMTDCSWGRWYKRQAPDKGFIRRLVADIARRDEALALAKRALGYIVDQNEEQDQYCCHHAHLGRDDHTAECAIGRGIEALAAITKLQEGEG